MAAQPLATETLQFADSAECREWLLTLPLTNAQASHALLKNQIALAAQSGLQGLELLKILETLQEPVRHVQQQLGRKFAGKSLPLDAAEISAWEKSVTLWDELAQAYLVCRAAHVRGDVSLRAHGALIVMRCLSQMTSGILEYYRIRHQPPESAWSNLHQMYVFAEQSGFAGQSVNGVLDRRSVDASCATVYCRALLMHLANPFALTLRQMDFVAQWLESWAGLVGISADPPAASATPLLAVDLAGKHSAAPASELPAGPGLRYLNLEHLGRTLRQLITLLKQGQTPGQLGLGEDARQPGCENLMMLLYVQWCRTGAARREERDPSAEKAQVCLGMRPAHFHITGRAFRAPGASLSRQEEHDMQLFGHISERTQHMLATGGSAVFESWQIVNHSTTGFMCMLRGSEAPMRIQHNQLMAVRGASASDFQVGTVQWLRVEEGNALYVGVRLFPGAVFGVAARPVNFSPVGSTGFERALLMPESPTLPATLIVPVGWFQAGRFVEIYGEKKQVAKLVSLLEKGSDFERCIVSLS